MHRDPVTHADSDRRNFATRHPDTGQTVARRRGDAVVRQQFDQQSFNPAQITMQILSATAKIDDGITDELTGSVIGRLPAAVDRKKRMRQMRAAAQTRLVRCATDGVNRIVFEKQQFVA